MTNQVLGSEESPASTAQEDIEAPAKHEDANRLVQYLDKVLKICSVFLTVMIVLAAIGFLVAVAVIVLIGVYVSVKVASIFSSTLVIAIAVVLYCKSLKDGVDLLKNFTELILTPDSKSMWRHFKEKLAEEILSVVKMSLYGPCALGILAGVFAIILGPIILHFWSDIPHAAAIGLALIILGPIAIFFCSCTLIPCVFIYRFIRRKVLEKLGLTLSEEEAQDEDEQGEEEGAKKDNEKEPATNSTKS